jgi:hypothetical protein
LTGTDQLVYIVTRYGEEAPMDSSTLAFVGRGVIGGVLLLSAGWKLMHQQEFLSAYQASVSRRLEVLDRSVSRTLPFAEGAVGLLVLVPTEVGRIGAAIAIPMLLAFSVSFAANRDSESGCGCWRRPIELGAERYRRLVLMRNLLIVVLAIPAVVVSPPTSLAPVAFGLTVGLLVAVLLMELPAMGQIAFAKRAAP